jgi:5-methylthioadenosine/S-adenosylhomocysteine deaminase
VPIETYEVQVKVKIDDIDQVKERLHQPEFKIIRSSIRNQYDSYFLFEKENLGRVRHREDEILNPDGTPREVFYRITLIGPTVEGTFDDIILLTRSRYSAAADKSRRFYREYFNPSREVRVEKYRQRYHFSYKDTQFVLNLDTLAGEAGTYLEIKSRTWSAKDAEWKATLIGELLSLLGAGNKTQVFREYIDLADDRNDPSVPLD